MQNHTTATNDNINSDPLHWPSCIGRHACVPTAVWHTRLCKSLPTTSLAVYSLIRDLHQLPLTPPSIPLYNHTTVMSAPVPSVTHSIIPAVPQHLNAHASTSPNSQVRLQWHQYPQPSQHQPQPRLISAPAISRQGIPSPIGTNPGHLNTSPNSMPGTPSPHPSLSHSCHRECKPLRMCSLALLNAGPVE